MASGFNAHPVGEDINFVGNVVNGSEATGITYQAASGVIANNTIRDAATAGINVQPLTVGPHDIIVEGNRVRRSGSAGILFLTSASWPNAGGVSIVGNSVDDAVTNGIDLDCSLSAISRATVSNNRVRGAVIQSINVRGVTLATISGNVVEHSGSGSPLRLWSVADSTVVGNALRSSVSVHGITTVSPTTGCVINSNRITGCNRGISLVAGANNNIATGNQLQGNTTALLDSGTGNTTTGNLT
jgi:parallel beta-helix repeat protein